MANTAAVCTSYKADLLAARHNHATGGNTFNFALYYASGSLGASTTAYSTTAEVSGTGYTAKGAPVTNVDPATSGAVGYWGPTVAVSWGTLSASAFDTALLYNDTLTTPVADASCAVYTFGSQTVTAGNFSLSMPAATSAAALLRIA